jgi:hypothetical protein
MATITIIKKYEFCDDIFKNILSYIKPKPMTTIGKRLLTPEFQEIFNQYRRIYNLRLMESDKADAKVIYRLRMLVSYEQFQFERTALAETALKNHEDYLETLGYVNGVYMRGWFLNTLPDWRSVMYVMRCDKLSFTMLNKLRHCKTGKDFKQNHLYDICDAGKKSSKHHNKLEQKRIKNAKRREIVSCECCGKMLTRGSLSRHTKKCSVV